MTSEPRRERKVITVLFADLVGFTSRAEQLDPEDVEAILQPYHERLQRELEHYGGTVEKFIGDAVMALFGAPVAHEDDPERAVRAALAIRQYAGEEGIELRRIVDADPELITWRQGRCLAYGDGVAFWALAEVVKAQAGILERDSEAEAAEKLRVAVTDAIDDESDARWVESHLGPLVGLESETVLGGDRRGEAFAAWRRYLEALAEQRPLVLVFEERHC